MKVKNKFILGTAVVVAMLVIGGSTNVHADWALQSVPGTAGTSLQWSAGGLFSIIRNMETAGHTLGLDININDTSRLEIVEGGQSNNGVDVHMAKNTEWGTAAMLADSAYGKVGNSDTTTGNVTGIYDMINASPEYVSGILEGVSNDYISKIINADDRYMDKYTENGYKNGDGLYDWLGASNKFFVNSTYPIFIRGLGFSNGIFDYRRGYGNGQNSDFYPTSRAALVCHTGI